MVPESGSAQALVQRKLAALALACRIFIEKGFVPVSSASSVVSKGVPVTMEGIEVKMIRK